MRTDTLLYQLFLQLPSLFFALIGEDTAKGDDYTFTSVEVKKASFRADGVFLPNIEDGFVYFLETQFQRDQRFYSRFFAQIFLYLRHHEPAHDWRAVVIFARKSDDGGIPRQRPRATCSAHLS